MAAFKTIKVGKPINLDDLKKKAAAPRGHQLSPRDEDLARLVNEVSVGPVSQVLPWHYDGKAATARVASRADPSGRSNPSSLARTARSACPSHGARPHPPSG
jgi:hypothetical protein